ncbi:hypothetical protein MNV49_002151 [Pseudohyphozyma bogoriensis]|nr:hypothetical protein MNV49_002151 [Pseudohyphozyma bogoriensis]
MSNLSFYAIPAAWVLSITPHFYAIGLSKTCKDLPDFDNVSPREFIARCRTLEKQSPSAAKYLRAEAAQQNGFENLGFFAAAIVAGNLGGLGNSVMNKIAAGYLASRVVYNFLYITTTTDGLSNLRTVSFLAGIGLIWTPFILLGNKFNQLL